MIALRNVTFQYEGCKEGVRDIDLTVHDGECVVLTGPSGGGKTTLTRLIGGLAPSYYQGTLRGSILVNDTEITALPSWRISREIGSVFQDPKSQFFSSELAGEVAFACENYGMSKSEIRERTEEAIASFGLEGLRLRPLDVLSSGEKQRVAVASVYALRPHTYVCDEPTANLDDEGAKSLSDTFRRLKNEGNTLIIVEHRLAWLHGIADRFIYIADGTVQWERTLAQMRELPEEERRRYGLRETVETEYFPPSLPKSIGKENLSVTHLSFRRKKSFIFENLNFSLPVGRITALTGKNGAGKTTLAMVLTGLWKQSGGEIYISGKSLSAGKRRKAVWYSSNDTRTQFFTNSVTDELLLHSETSPGRLERARTLLKTLGLYAYKDVHPAALSGGQKQRLSIACGLLSDREILLFDEPTSGLDGGNMRIIASVLTNAAAGGKTILVITHDKELMQACCNFRWELGQ